MKNESSSADPRQPPLPPSEPIDRQWTTSGFITLNDPTEPEPEKRGPAISRTEAQRTAGSSDN